MTAATFSEPLHQWARKRAVNLADEYVRGLAGISETPASFFEGTCAKERLLAALRATAEPVYVARIAELEGSGS